MRLQAVIAGGERVVGKRLACLAKRLDFPPRCAAGVEHVLQVGETGSNA